MPSLLEVLYEDNHLIAVFKPAGLLTQGDETGDESLMDVVKAFLKEKYGKPGNVFLGLIHRLDRPVAGVVLFGKTSKGAARLSEQFRTRAVKKIYQAVVEGAPKAPQGELIGVVDGKPAQLSYRVLGTSGGRSLVEVELGTGRKHQIRIQFSEIGCPIVGDIRHGAAEAAREAEQAIRRGLLPPFPPGIALVAKRLEFDHPVRKEERIIVEIPERLDPLHKRFP